MSAWTAPVAASTRALGWRTTLGNGEVTSFAEMNPDGSPSAIGIILSATALNTLPTESSDQHHCFDRDGDGVTARATECAHTHEFAIPLPDVVTQRKDTPFTWVLLNWNRHGHMPPGVYDSPHFDVHFYLTPIEDVFAIHDGPCGPELVNCDHFAEAKKPVPAELMHPDFSDVDAVAPAMGNHLIDLTGAEFNGEPFTRSWIYGVYGGKVTFYEEMVALSHLLTRPNACLPIKSPPAVAVDGYYPTQRCLRYEGATGNSIVSLEGFVHRSANGQASSARGNAASTSAHAGH